MRFSAFVVFLVASTIAKAAFPARLVPTKRASLERRGVSKRELIPRDTVVLSYADAPYLPPAASVVLTAHESRPLLLLEDLDHVLQDVICPSLSTISLTFVNEDILLDARMAWQAFPRFVIVTAHPTCNADGEHGAWSVDQGSISHTGRTITITSTRVPLRDVVKSFAVRYDHAGVSTWDARDALGLARRDEHGLSQNINFGFNPDIPARLPLFPPNSTLDKGVSATVLNELTQADIALTCVDCTMHSNVTIGIDFGVDIADSSCVVDANTTCFTFNRAAMNFTVEEFEQTAALEVALGRAVSTGANYKIMWVPVAPALKIPSLIDLGPAIGIEVAFEVDLYGGVNFTYGAKGKIPSGAFASVSLVNSTGDWDPQVAASGWDGAGVDQIPFRMNSGELNMTTSIAFAPYAEIAFTVLDVGAALRLIQNVPKVSNSAAMRVSVNRDCQPLGANDFESFDTAFELGAGMELSMAAQLVLEEGAFRGGHIPGKWDISLYSRDIPFEPALGLNTSACFVLSSGGLVVNGTSTTLAGVPGSTGTLVAARSAIPTWNVPGIASYYAQHSQLPSNVDYALMVQATSVPADVQAAVSATAAAQASETAKSEKNSAREMEWARAWSGIVVCILAAFILV